MTEAFQRLYDAAKRALNPRALSEDSSAGEVAAAIETDKGNIYTGVCIDTPCSMGFCAEHAAAAAMITAGENRVIRMLAVYADGTVIPPCGRCREFISHLHDQNIKADVQVDGETVYSLGALLPYRWTHNE